MTAVDTSAPGALMATRGTVLATASKEHLQIGLVHALAAAAGCTVSTPFPDYNGIDCIITLASESHTDVWEAKIDVQLKCTHTATPNTIGYFPFDIKNKHLEKLNTTKITQPRLLFVMLVPQNLEKWLHTAPNWTLIRHSMYWVDLRGVPVTGKEKTRIQVPYKNRLDPVELCRLLHAVGNGDPL